MNLPLQILSWEMGNQVRCRTALSSYSYAEVSHFKQRKYKWLIKKRGKQANNANPLSLPAKHTDNFFKSTGRNSGPMSPHADQKALWGPIGTDHPFALKSLGLQTIAVMFCPRGAHSHSFSSALLTRADTSWSRAPCGVSSSPPCLPWLAVPV